MQKNLKLLVAVLALASEAYGQKTDRPPEVEKCSASGGNWDGATKVGDPHCQCPESKGLVNWLSSAKCPQPAERHGAVSREDICVKKGGTLCGGTQVVTKTVVKEVKVSVMTPPDQACQQLCERWGDLAEWSESAELARRCQPTNHETHYAGPCDLWPVPEREPICQEMCEGLGGLWTPSAPVATRCQPTAANAEHFTAAKCGLVQKPVVVTDTERETFRSQDIPRFHVGGELVGVSFGRGDVSAPFSAGPGLRFRFDMLDPERLTVLAGAGILWNGRGDDAKNTPVGLYLHTDGLWFHWAEDKDDWRRHLGFGAGVHRHQVATDRTENSLLVEYGATANLAWRGIVMTGKHRWVCSAMLAPGMGRVNPYERNVFVGFISVGCDRP